jgi:2-aminoadipate transaminase
VLPHEIVTTPCGGFARGVEQLQYGSNAGRPGLRAAIAQMLCAQAGEEALDLGAEQVIVTNGSQQALYLLAQVLCDPGDIVLVEAPSYFVFLELLAGLGVEAVSVPMREDGQVDPEGLRAMIGRMRRKRRLGARALRVLRHLVLHPSGLCMDAEFKRGVGEVLGHWRPRCPWSKTQPTGSFTTGRRTARRRCCRCRLQRLPVVHHLGTFSKPLSPGLKVGYAARPTRPCLRTCCA